MAKPRTQCHKFFKIYLPNSSSQQLGIPPAFVRHFNGTIPKDAVLKDQTGKLWLVNLEEGERHVTIKNGWQCFASENSLGFGDFLTFEYDGKCLFDVEIFGKNGCKKEALTTTHAMNEKATEEVEISSAPTHTCKQKYSKSAVKWVKNLDLAEASRHNKSRRNRRTIIGEGKVLKAARYVTPKGPYFVTSIGTWMRYVMYIPKSLLHRYGIKVGPEMVLLDQNGKEWPVTLRFRTDGRALINHGWGLFWKEYNLQIGDKCVFEFVLGRGNLSQKFIVQVIRRQSKLHRRQIGKA